MRRLFVAAVAAAGLAGVLAHDSHSVSRRKTLSFGPVLPHAAYHTNPVYHTSLLRAQDPFEVAQIFVEDLIRDIPGGSYQIRKDSYTDQATGVTHVYARQYMNGIEVADGDINLNVKDGVVLSYGDSFFRPAGLHNMGHDVDPHSDYCRALESEIVDQLQQVDVSKHDRGVAQEALGQLGYLYDWNCQFVNLPDFMAESPDFASAEDAASGDVTRALLQFMIAATPSEELSAEMLANTAKYLADMGVTFEHHLTGERTPTFTVDNVPDAVNPVKGRLAFVQVPNGDETALSLVWKFEVEMKDNWYEAAVSAEAPHRIISVVDWASDSPMPVAPVPPKEQQGATYNVFGWGINDPSVGERSIQKENFDALASPLGWHALPYAKDPQSSNLRLKDSSSIRNTTTTWGNNVFAHEDWEGRNNWLTNYRPDAGAAKAFDYKYSPKETTTDDALEEAQKYINATVTQLFYTSNLVHDLYYRYGFTEVAGNFQQHNFGRGGQENDGVIANAQDGSGYNNANFMTPPDGQNGRCRMYLWNTANPYRDGDLEAGIVIHELSHGLSTRLTGGPANSGCLGWGEAGGMGEGWGDFLATTIRSNKVYSDYPMGSWAANVEKGIRNYPYSLNETTNPSTYKTLDKPGYWGVHAIGEVWAQMLWVVSQRLIAKHGFVDDLFPPKPLEDGTVPEGDFYRARQYDAQGNPKPLIPKHGNSLIVQLVLDGMKLQPCRPSFTDARDAIIAADKTLTGGENFCELWQGFGDRGLGVNAKVEGRTPWGGGVRTNGYRVPAECSSDVPPPEEPAPGDGDGDDDGDDDDWPWLAWVLQHSTPVTWLWPF
ncbi:Fungalysin metallopeptidase-domain-containing protein [Ganoderma leucocontextum]|nr:Fungalysin metallopeptidase-domain-containing protein [Ganoderma leucocontextum]